MKNCVWLTVVVILQPVRMNVLAWLIPVAAGFCERIYTVAAGTVANTCGIGSIPRGSAYCTNIVATV